MAYTTPENHLIVWRGPTQLFGDVTHANRFSTRLRGLIGQPPLTASQGLLITPCNQVHTLGMRQELDLVFLDKAGVVLRCVQSIKPNRAAICRGAQHTLELATGAIEAHAICVGQSLQWTNVTATESTTHSISQELLS